MPVLRIGLVVWVLGLSGCCCCMAKRQSELNCPTDIRQTVPWCAGEDAIFHCPCGPEHQFYGYKPTCWSVWPADAAQWRDAGCGPQMTAAGCEVNGDNPTLLPTPVPGPVQEFTPRPPLVRNVGPERDPDEPVPTLPTPLPGPVPEITPRPPSVRNAGPERDPGEPVPTLPTSQQQPSGARPTGGTGPPLWPTSAANVQVFHAAGSLTQLTLARPQEEQRPRTRLRHDGTEGVGDPPLLPERLVVFQPGAQEKP
jgi:hypothetical protein